ncbi:MAG: carbamoyltransferase HypF [Planctomycetales bacterium]
MIPRAAPEVRIAIRLSLRGQVQGRGVRPAVARLAHRLDLAGSVRNTLGGLEISVEGESRRIDEFRESLPEALPAGCRPVVIDESEIEAAGREGFSILRDDAEGPLLTPLPLDVAVCDECLDEFDDPRDRRHGYPLTTCAACGPRYTIVRAMPYERADTTMAGFPLCPACAAEYASSDDRRFHAQTIACPDCGPRVYAADAHDGGLGRDEQAVQVAIAALRAGRIVAVRGVGGYQLLCDAGNDAAVRTLRARKERPARPLAVMVETIDEADRLAQLSHAERAALTDPSNPIVLVRSRENGLIAPSVHPGLDTLGLLLPTTPLHHRLACGAARPLVCTSANREGDPLEYQPAEAERRLAGIPDLWLHHDRPIERPIDDSVVRAIEGRIVTIRLARGMAPLPLDLALSEPALALGGHQKVAAAWSTGAQSALGPHVGDLDSLAARERLLAQLEDWRRLYRFVPARLAHDAHPDYFTTRHALVGTGRRSGRESPTSSPRRIAVQHHFAHVAAGMLEHGLLDEAVLGVAWDGTGYGTDGTIWGGEFLLVDRARSFERVAHLRPFVLAGGEAAIREPWRTAAGVLNQAIGGEELRRHGLPGVDPTLLAQLLPLLDLPRLSPRTTSAGRLFDAAAAILLPLPVAQFDGQAAMMLEAAADPSADGTYPLPLSDQSPAQLDWRPLFAALWNDLRTGVTPGAIATRFHRALADGISAVARRYFALPVVFGGGVFQNRLLTETVVQAIDGPRRLRLPGRIPPNDGGLAAGQLAIAARSIRHR